MSTRDECRECAPPRAPARALFEDRGGDWLCVHEVLLDCTLLYRRSTIPGTGQNWGIYADDWLKRQHSGTPVLPSVALRRLDLASTPHYHRCWFALAVSL